MTAKLDDATSSGDNIATVKWRATDENIFAIGCAHNSPLMDTREYKVYLEDGTTDRYFDNLTA